MDWVLPKNSKIVLDVNNLRSVDYPAEFANEINVFCFVCSTVDCTYETAV